MFQGDVLKSIQLVLSSVDLALLSRCFVINIHISEFKIYFCDGVHVVAVEANSWCHLGTSLQYGDQMP
jgi:hypothetical protein